MAKRMILLISLLGLFLVNVFQPFKSIKERAVEDVSFPPTGQFCTSFCQENGDHCIFGTNLDHGKFQVGQVFVNKRNMLKTAWDPSISGEYARWISKYGSVTFNLVGYQLVWGGMNEAGLMISSLSLLETVEPPPDERPPITSGFWLQYLLDNYRTIEEVIASNDLVRPKDEYDHYLVCDRDGDCAIIEFLNGEMVVYSGPSLPVQALSNSTYQDSLAALEDGNYWKVKARGVSPDGPAAEAGVLENDWIRAVNGTALVGQESLDTFLNIIGQHNTGDELELTLVHPGMTNPVTETLKMAPLPEDMSKYVIPPAVPVQVLSLGFIPVYPGDFLTRFATAAKWVEAFKLTGPEEAVASAFSGLEAVSVDDTVLSAVFDPANQQIYFHTNQNPDIRHINFTELDFSCGTPAMMLDFHAGTAGDISNELMEYSHKLVIDHTLPIATNLWQVDVPPLYVKIILAGFESFTCMEGNASAMADPQHYLETHPALVPPIVGWIGLMAIKQFGYIWVALTLVSIGFIAWHLARKQQTTKRNALVWVLTVVIFGPFGLLAYLMTKSRRRWASQSMEG